MLNDGYIEPGHLQSHDCDLRESMDEKFSVVFLVLRKINAAVREC